MLTGAFESMVQWIFCLIQGANPDVLILIASMGKRAEDIRRLDWDWSNYG